MEKNSKIQIPKPNEATKSQWHKKNKFQNPNPNDAAKPQSHKDYYNLLVQAKNPLRILNGLNILNGENLKV